MTAIKQFTWVVAAALGTTSFIGCSSSDGKTGLGIGGATHTGGSAGAAAAGAPASGGITGSSGASGSNGASGSSGAMAAFGGSAAGGSAAGGSASTGGARSASGGASAGGATSAGGAGVAVSGGNTAAGASGASSVAPSTGCGVSGSSTGTAQDKTLSVSGQSTPRTYRLSVPTNYSPQTPLPLIIGFHGVGGTGKGTQSSFGLESATTGGGKAIFAYPDALTKVEPDGSTAVDWDTTNTGVDFAFFDALISELETHYCIDTHRIFATGISAGGIFTNFMGCWRGNVLRAVAPVASMKPWATPNRTGDICNGEVAAMVIHGTNDPYSDYTTDGLGARDFWIKQNSCQPTNPPPVADATTPNACVDFQGCDTGYPVVMCSHDEGHAWPVKSGFSCSSSSMVCFDANVAVWNFFSTLP